MIATQSMNLLREKLAHCFRTEGVNHFTNCKELREKYFSLCQDRFNGMVLPPGLEISNRGDSTIKKF